MKHEIQTTFLSVLIIGVTGLIGTSLLIAAIPLTIGLPSPFLQFCLKMMIPASGNEVIWRSLYGFVLLILTVTICYKIIRQAYLNIALQRKLKQAETRFLQDREISISFLVIDEKRPIAFTAGFFKPQIVISSVLTQQYPEAELRAIILHEYYHQMKRDPLKIMILRSLVQTFWFLPILKKALAHYETLRELLADKYVIRRMDADMPLASAILRTIRYQQQRGAVQIGFTSGSLDVRIRQIIHPSDTEPRLPLVQYTGFLGLLVLVLGFTGSCV